MSLPNGTQPAARAAMTDTDLTARLAEALRHYRPAVPTAADTDPDWTYDPESQVLYGPVPGRRIRIPVATQVPPELGARAVAALNSATREELREEAQAAALLPVVREIAALLAADRVAAVAEELDDLYETEGAFGADNLNAAARLDRHAAALRGETGR